MSFRLLLLCAALFGVSLFSPAQPDWAAGLSGERLLEAVRAHSRPNTTVDAASLKETLMKVDRLPDGTILNRFSGTIFNTTDLSTDVSILRVMHHDWFDEAPANSKPLILTDLYNCYLCDDNIVQSITSICGPGVPEYTDRGGMDNGIIRIGELANGVGVWEFPKEYSGELARAFFYMVAVYPVTQWAIESYNFLDENLALSIKEETLAYLLDCHESYPPTEREIERARTISSIQGNTNPFIEYPELIGLIWDNTAAGDDSGSDGETQEQEFLKAVYYAGADKYVYLRSPYVSDDAQWKIDGNSVTQNPVSLSTLSKGRHLLEYTAPGEKGKITIDVR